MRPRSGANPLLLVACALATACAVAFPPWADDWDGLGFLASVPRFDLAAFAPHPPGYPVYVALLKLGALVVATPIGAARLVAIVSAVVTVVALARTLEGLGASRGEDALGAAAVCVTPLVFHTLSGVGSEGPALACAAVASVGVFASMSSTSAPRIRIVLVGLGVGLGLGVRLSWAPIYLPFLILVGSGKRGRATLIAMLACLAWGLPLVLLTGPMTLLALLHTHLEGHVTAWGGTVVTQPSRLPFLFRDLFVDGLGCGTDVLGVLIGVALALAIVTTLARRRHLAPLRGEAGRGTSVALLVFPYLAWVLLGQNLAQQPRHVLPLLVVVMVGLTSRGVGGVLPSARSNALLPDDKEGGAASHAVLMLLVMLLVARTSRDAVARKTIPPPGEQLLAYVREHAPMETTAVFAGASGRFLDGTDWQHQAHPAATMGDVLLAMSRLDTRPSHVFVTSEIKGATDGTTLATRLCRPERIERRLPCLDVYSLDMKPGRTR